MTFRIRYIPFLLPLLNACGQEPSRAASSRPAAYELSHSIANFYQVDEHVYRGGRPDRGQIEELMASGIKSVLSLETYAFEFGNWDNEEDMVRGANLRFFGMPMNPLPYPEPTVDQLRSAVEIMADANNQPIFVHCYHGRDRTGLVVGAYRILVNHWSAQQAIAELRSIGHSSSLFDYWDDLLYQIR